MDVTCERCQTEYEFDETLISDRGTTVKCTHCGHLFKIFRTGSGPHALPGGGARVWTLRRTSGETLTFDRLATLQQWILEARVDKKDEISRTGETWKELGTIAELATFFAAASARATSVDGAKTVEYQSLDDAPTQATSKEPTHKGLAPQPPAGRGRPEAARTAKATMLGVAPGGAPVVPAASPPAPAPSPPASAPASPPAAGAVIGRAVSPTLETAQTLRSKPEGSGAPAADKAQPVAPPPPQAPPSPKLTPLASPPPAPTPARPVAAPTPAPPVAPPPARPVAPPAPAAQARIAPPRMTPATREPTPSPATRGAAAAASAAIAADRASIDASSLPAMRDSFDSGLVPAVAVVEPSGDVGSVRPSMGGQPAWADSAQSLGAIPAEAIEQGSAESVTPPVVRRSNRTLGIVLMLGVLVVIMGGIAAFGGSSVARFFGGAFSAPPPAPPQEDRAGALVERGRAALLVDREADLDQAIATFQQALGVSSEDGRALAALGEALALQAQTLRDEADDLDEKARRLRPAEGADPAVAGAELRARAKVLRESSAAKVTEARGFAERAVRAAPDLPAAQRARADALRLGGDLPGARAALAQALSRDASSAENRYASAMLALETADTKPQARVDLREAILANPRMVRAILRLARLDALEGDVASARAGAQRALDVQTDHARARALLAAIDAGDPPVVPVEIAMGDNPIVADGGAATPPTPPTPQTPDAGTVTPPPAGPGATPPGGGRSPDWFVGEGERLMRNGQAEQARRAFEQALALQPGRSEALAGLGFVLLSLGDARGAMTQFRRLLDTNPSYAAAYYGMGQAAQRLGQTSVAVQNYRRFLESSSSGPRAEAARRFLESVEGPGPGEPPPPDNGGGNPPPDPGGATPPPDDGNALPPPRDMTPGTEPPADRPAPESEPAGLPPVSQ